MDEMQAITRLNRSAPFTDRQFKNLLGEQLSKYSADTKISFIVEALATHKGIPGHGDIHIDRRLRQLFQQFFCIGENLFATLGSVQVHL